MFFDDILFKCAEEHINVSSKFMLLKLQRFTFLTLELRIKLFGKRLSRDLQKKFKTFVQDL
jgi:hypothetical protein